MNDRPPQLRRIKLDPDSVARLLGALRAKQRARHAVGECISSTDRLQIRLLVTIRRIDRLVAEYHRMRAATSSRNPHSRLVRVGSKEEGHS